MWHQICTILFKKCHRVSSRQRSLLGIFQYRTVRLSFRVHSKYTGYRWWVERRVIRRVSSIIILTLSTRELLLLCILKSLALDTLLALSYSSGQYKLVFLTIDIIEWLNLDYSLFCLSSVVSIILIEKANIARRRHHIIEYEKWFWCPVVVRLSLDDVSRRLV